MGGKRLASLPFYVLLAVGVLTALVFAASGLEMSGGFERAWEILLGIESPFGEVSGLGLVLSALGYIVVPTVIGVAAGAGITLFTNRRLTTVEEAVADIQEMADADPAASPTPASTPEH